VKEWLAKLWMKVLHSVGQVREQIRMWEKPDCGDQPACSDSQHSRHQWSDSAHPDAVKTLREVLAKGSDIIRQCKPYVASTQGNEIVHRIKGKFSEKRLAVRRQQLRE
jgi:hypothetical protein